MKPFPIDPPGLCESNVLLSLTEIRLVFNVISAFVKERNRLNSLYDRTTMI